MSENTFNPENLHEREETDKNARILLNRKELAQKYSDIFYTSPLSMGKRIPSFLESDNAVEVNRFEQFMELDKYQESERIKKITETEVTDRLIEILSRLEDFGELGMDTIRREQTIHFLTKEEVDKAIISEALYYTLDALKYLNWQLSFGKDHAASPEVLDKLENILQEKKDEGALILRRLVEIKNNPRK